MYRNRLRLYLHLVWATWDRMPLIGQDMERDLYRFITGACLELGCTPLAVNGMPDHVHTLLTFPATLCIADIVERLKGSSSRFVNDKLRPDEFFKWQGHYGAFTVSAREKEKVRHYIENQKAHHAANTVWPSAEETLEPDPPESTRG
ncbi:MAG TPA: IS200/IS605 family transposase [Chthonomonadaceae bacterium]|nr:IS200/IS605 family transposase [Chthonomonadaceae bacterium]